MWPIGCGNQLIFVSILSKFLSEGHYRNCIGFKLKNNSNLYSAWRKRKVERQKPFSVRLITFILKCNLDDTKKNKHLENK